MTKVLNGAAGTEGAQGADGTEGAQGAEGAASTVAGPQGAQGAPGTGGGTSVNRYVARVEFDSTQTLVGGYFVDPSGTGDFTTSGASVSAPNGTQISFSFSNESYPPFSTVAFAASLSNASNVYKITHIDSGTSDNFFAIEGGTATSYTSGLGESNQVDLGLFSFGSLDITLDMAKGGFDWQRNPFGGPAEAHVYLIFSFA